ncbi:MAG: glucose-6-phosphate isomerase family protein [Candidatus Heimdallarchaeaceae archaeon]|jgi:glucose-6-phosphate isomerase
MDIRESIGLPIESDEKEISYNSNEVDIKNIIPYKKKDLQNFVKEKTWKTEEEEQEVFRIYQEVKKVEDKEIWEDILFDIIVIWSGFLGKEYHKTIGYQRSKAENGYRFPEIYQMAEGYAEFFLQQSGDKHDMIKEAIMIRAQKFDLIVIPPSYNVTIINPSEKKNIITRLRAADVEEITAEFARTKGECYYRVEEGRWEFNENYEEIPMLKLEEPQNTWKSMKRGIPIYASYTYNPKRYYGLVEPDPVDFVL